MNKAKWRKYDRRWSEYCIRCRKLNAFPIETPEYRQYAKDVQRDYAGYYSSLRNQGGKGKF